MIIYEQNNIRISLLTARLLRTEFGNFTDLPTQTVQNRTLDSVEYRLSKEGEHLIVHTDEVTFRVCTKNGDVASVTFADGRVVRDFLGGRLPGTARTLDNINGAVKMEEGIISTLGASVMDDSKTLLINPDNSISPRPECSDRYWFAYGSDYLSQLRDFFRLSGKVPLIPKFALGNWWSRYRAYTQEEYRGLMQKFIDREIPITVATIDMDWHWVDVVERFGEKAKAGKPSCREEIIFNTLMHGWTGYTWNTELFPDHKELLAWLHDHGFKVTLNVHPSQGIRFFEEQYITMLMVYQPQQL